MKKQPTPESLGLAAQLLYGPVAEQTSNNNVADSHQKVNPTKPVCRSRSERTPTYELGKRLRSFLMQDFEEGRPMPNSAYEREKRNLHRKPRTADEIQKERIKAARRCKV